MNEQQRYKNRIKIKGRPGRPPAPPKEEGKRVKIGVSVDDVLWRKLRALALLKDENTGVLLDKAIEEYLERNV